MSDHTPEPGRGLPPSPKPRGYEDLDARSRLATDFSYALLDLVALAGTLAVDPHDVARGERKRRVAKLGKTIAAVADAAARDAAQQARDGNEHDPLVIMYGAQWSALRSLLDITEISEGVCRDLVATAINEQRATEQN